MSTETILVILLLVLLVGSLPAWSYSREWGYGPSSLFTVLGVILILWLFFGDSDRHFGRGSDNISRPAVRGENSLDGAAQEVGDGLKKTGREIKRAVHDATD